MPDIEEVPPYEEWTVAELKIELKARGLNHAGVHKTLVNRLYLDDESEGGGSSSAPEVETQIETASEYAQKIEPEPEYAQSSWVDGNLFFKTFDVDLNGRNVLAIPSDIEHDNFRQETYSLAVNAGYTPVGGWTNAGLLNTFIIPGFVRLTYRVPLRN